MWHGKEIMIYGQATGGFCVCAGAQEQPANNWQSVGQRVGFTYLSRPRLSLSTGRAMSQLDNDGELSRLSQVSTGVWSIWHKLTIHMNENDKMARLGENDGFQWRKGWGK